MSLPDTSYLENPELVALEQKRLEVLMQLKTLRGNYGLDFYAPHRKQAAFHSAASFHYRYMRTGNRFGKSQMGAAEDSAYAMGERRWLSLGDPIRTLGIPKHPTKGLIICVDWDKAQEIFTNIEGQGELGKLFQYIPRESIKRVTKNHSGYIDKIVVGRPNGPFGGESLICIDTVQSFKQNKLSMESSVWDWIHVDEPCPKAMYVAAARGLVDRGGRSWFTCTPLEEAWINDMFQPNKRIKIDPELPLIDTDAETWMMTGSMSDNPYNSQEDINRFAKLLTDDEKMCRLNGKPLHLSGIVYKEFDDEAHILRHKPFGWEDWDTPPKSYTIRVSIDPHPQTPHAVVFIATSPEGYQFVFHEIFEAVLINELCDMIKAHTAGYFVQDCIIDPAANVKDPVTGNTMIQEFFDNGVFCVPATKDLTAGILSVKRHLRCRNANGKAVMMFNPDCKRMQFEFDHYMWKPDSSNKPVDKDDHTLECLYRLCLGGLDYIEPPTDGDYARSYAKDVELNEEISDSILLATSERRARTDFGSLRRKKRSSYPDAY